MLFIQGLTPGNVRGLTAGGMLDLDDDTGMGSFTIYSPPGTVDGATVRIFVGEGDLEAIPHRHIRHEQSPHGR